MLLNGCENEDAASEEQNKTISCHYYLFRSVRSLISGVLPKEGKSLPDPAFIHMVNKNIMLRGTVVYG